MKEKLLKIVMNPSESWNKLKAMPYFKHSAYTIAGLVTALLIFNPSLLVDLINVIIKVVQLAMLFAV